MLRCTAKVLALLRVSEPAIGQASQQDWYAHLVWMDRRKCLLVTHAGTLFSVFMPNVTAAGLRPIGPPVVSAIQAALQAEHLPVDTLGELDPQQVAVAKTADRRILGTITQLLITPSSSQTLHDHRIGAAVSAEAIAMVIRPGQRLWAGRRRHGNADTHRSPTWPAVPARTMSPRCCARRRAGPEASCGMSRK